MLASDQIVLVYPVIRIIYIYRGEGREGEVGEKGERSGVCERVRYLCSYTNIFKIHTNLRRLSLKTTSIERSLRGFADLFTI